MHAEVRYILIKLRSFPMILGPDYFFVLFPLTFYPHPQAAPLHAALPLNYCPPPLHFLAQHTY